MRVTAHTPAPQGAASNTTLLLHTQIKTYGNHAVMQSHCLCVRDEDTDSTAIGNSRGVVLGIEV